MDRIEDHDAVVQRIVALLGSSRDILCITGAGISADSGLPTYRGIGGLYEADVTEDGLEIESLLSGRMMRQHPELTWKYLLQIEQACRGAKLNRGHEVLAEMEAGFRRVCVLTQNIDGFHRQAGSRNVIDIHGDLHELYCTRCEHRQQVRDYRDLNLPPRCPDCGSTLRPNVVLFGEVLPVEKVHMLMEEMEAGFDLLFTIGTTSVFPYIAEPVHWARRQGVPSVEINPGRSEVSHLVSERLPVRAAAALDAIWNRYKRT